MLHFKGILFTDFDHILLPLFSGRTIRRKFYCSQRRTCRLPLHFLFLPQKKMKGRKDLIMSHNITNDPEEKEAAIYCKIKLDLL
jgi:hypothetical protein